MEVMNKELMRYYLEKILEKKNGSNVVEKFIHDALKEDEMFLPLEDYLSIIVPGHKASLPKGAINLVELDDKINPLFKTEFEYEKKTEKYIYSIILQEKAKINTVYLLKVHLISEEAAYYVITHVNLYEDNPISKIDFMLRYLPELTSGDIKNKEVAYGIRNVLFEKIIDYFSYYDVKNEEMIIKLALLINNDQEKLDVNKFSKKYYEITYGNKKFTLQYIEAKITPMNDRPGTNYRARGYRKYDKDIDGYIVRAYDEEKDENYFVYATFAKNDKGQRELELIKDYDKRKINVKFKKDKNRYQLISNERDLYFDYIELKDADLS